MFISDFTDEELLERLHQAAAAHEAELVEQQASGVWEVRFMRYNALSDQTLSPASGSRQRRDLTYALPARPSCTSPRTPEQPAA